jgi:anthranilate phosphoribosyltransferase
VSSGNPVSTDLNLVTFAQHGGWPAVLSRVTAGSELEPELLHAAFSEILRGHATSGQIAAFAIGMRTKGETVAELSTVLATMEEFGVSVPLDEATRATAICTCGTGGDRSHSINISTTAAFVVAGAGGIVCKHGGRAASSASGSADVLEALGVALEITPEGVARCVREVGVGFCLAPRFHPALRHAGPTRKELGVATMFNFLGPLANPGHILRQLVGVSDPAMAPKMLGVLQARGADHAIVVFGHDGLDELTITTTSTMLTLRNGEISEQTVDPASFGIAYATVDQLRGGAADENARFLRAVLEGTPGPHRDVVLLNAAAACVVAGLADDLDRAFPLAVDAVDSGRALAALESLIRVSQEEAAKA